MWDGRCLEGRTQSGAFSVGNIGKGQIDCGKGEKSGITMCIPDQLELIMAIQRRASIRTSLPWTQKTGEHARLSLAKLVNLRHELKA
jgi:hypothetical protein